MYEFAPAPGVKVNKIAGLSDDLSMALEHTEEILAYLAGGGTLEGAEEPLRIYFICYSALEKGKDPRAQEILQAANELLEAQVSKLGDEESRLMYVQNVPWRLAIQTAWEARSKKSKG